MQIRVSSSVDEVRADDLIHKTVVVIDVLRATSTIITALAHYASSVIPVETVGQAKAIEDNGDLLGGERFCKKIAGFHLGNSPLEYEEKVVANRRIILTTTNGTRAIQKSVRGSQLLITSFLNASASVKRILERKKDVHIVCSGTRNQYAIEDGLCAGLLIELLYGSTPDIETDDLGETLRSAYAYHRNNLADVMMKSESGKRLQRLGLQDDVSYCAQLDLFDFVPVLAEGIPFSIQKG